MKDGKPKFKPKKLKGSSVFVGLPEVAGRGGHVKDTKNDAWKGTGNVFSIYYGETTTNEVR